MSTISTPKGRAQFSKEKGNEAFKKADYANAIGFYTAAWMEDPEEPTYPLNRAAAYLKLGKNEDAEKDCTIVLKLSPKNVKAMFRRAQAYYAMSKLHDAQKDLQAACELEPKNESILLLIGEIDLKLQAKREKAMAAAAAGKFVDPNASKRRRRVPINIIEDSAINPPASKSDTKIQFEAPKASDGSGLTAVSSRPLKTSPESTTLPHSTSSTVQAAPEPLNEIFPPNSSLPPSAGKPRPTPASFKDAKDARTTSRPSRVGGGIFHATGSSKVFTNRETAGEKGKSPPIKAPETYFELAKAWNARRTPEERWALLSTIRPLKFPSLCKTSMEPEFLATLVETFNYILNTADLETQILVKSYMDVLPDIQRFNTLFMFLIAKEKAVVREVLSKLGVDKPEGQWAELLK
ncbi:TPR-like protein [Coprinopsis marcescibilis]|uniref:RNA polymerase II-associated protein 3 n=1 Tax=Coprinopsis marcescibilis TaxID=230819 RepID=A0A5C3KSG4_COPMA|nr:TPR-like protein [Coprinopsis marcescibilis]